MPSLSLFIEEQGIGRILNRLNADLEIEFIVPDLLPQDREAQPRLGVAFTLTDGELKEVVESPRRWKAVQTVDALVGGLRSLWHVPAGPLPLIEVNTGPRKPQNTRKIHRNLSDSQGLELPSPDLKTQEKFSKLNSPL